MEALFLNSQHEINLRDGSKPVIEVHNPEVRFSLSYSVRVKDL